MKKFIKASSVLSLIILSAALFSACESIDQPTVQANGTPASSAEQTVSESVPASVSAEPKAEASAADITSAIMAEIEIQSAVEKTVGEIGAFYDVDTEAITEMSVFICGSGAYPDELAVFKCVDSNGANDCEKAVKKRLENQTALYTDYTPNEVYKLENAVLIRSDRWVILTVCSDNSRAKEIIESLL